MSGPEIFLCQCIVDNAFSSQPQTLQQSLRSNQEDKFRDCCRVRPYLFSLLICDFFKWVLYLDGVDKESVVKKKFSHN